MQAQHLTSFLGRWLLAGALLGTAWWSLTRVDWVGGLQLDRASDRTEAQLGKVLMEALGRSDREVDSPVVVSPVAGIVDKVCAKNGIPKQAIDVHIIKESDVNAFALPGGHLIVHTGLIASSRNPEELCGVIAHEIAHIQLHHVMRKLAQEVGFAALTSMVAGGSGTEMAGQTVKMLASSAFDRMLEKEADLKAVDYMVNSGVEPSHFADFLYSIAFTSGHDMEPPTWVSSHPASKQRAAYVLEYGSGKAVKAEPIVSNQAWAAMKKAVGTE